MPGHHIGQVIGSGSEPRGDAAWLHRTLFDLIARSQRWPVPGLRLELPPDLLVSILLLGSGAKAMAGVVDAQSLQTETKMGVIIAPVGDAGVNGQTLDQV